MSMRLGFRFRRASGTPGNACRNDRDATEIADHTPAEVGMVVRGPPYRFMIYVDVTAHCR